jgi:predicted transglutaminase-like cysteine proteinase
MPDAERNPAMSGRIRQRPLRPRGLAAMLLVLLLPGYALAAGPFGTQEVAFRGTLAYPRFGEMTARYASQFDEAAACPAAGGRGICGVAREWAGLITSVSGLGRRAQVAAINRWFNRLDYVDDLANWGVGDYWETPFEFLDLGRGDCEAFAIAKYYTLRALGFDVTTLRIVIVDDRRRNMQHAVLAVFLDGEVLILDNLADEPVPDLALRHYQPLMSINELGVWVPV